MNAEIPNDQKMLNSLSALTERVPASLSSSPGMHDLVSTDSTGSDSQDRYRVLVLNRNWQAVNIVGVKRAFSLLWQDHAFALNTTDGQYSPLSAEEWIAFSTSASPSPGRVFISTVRLDILLPKVLVLRQYDRIPVSEVKFNRENVFSRDHYTCQYSGKRCRSSELTLDHVIPRERGGRTSWENIVTCSREVNAMKANRLPHEVGLKLVRKPEKPKWRPFSADPGKLGSIESDWRPFFHFDKKAEAASKAS